VLADFAEGRGSDPLESRLWLLDTENKERDGSYFHN
jgi:hypothetical protein